MSETVELRLFRPSDLPQITELERSVYGSGAYSYYFFRQLHDLFPRLVWVAERNGLLAGHICGAIAQDGETGWVLNFAVQAHFRRLGVGHRLMERCMREMVDAGVKRIRTTIVPDNDAGFGLCERLGFRKLEVGEDYYGDGTDRLILEYIVEGA